MRLRNIDDAENRPVARLTITLLGDFAARIGPGPPLRLRTRKAQALLAYLALPAGQTHSRDKLATLLWGDEPPTHGRARLRETIFALRKALAYGNQAWLQTGGDALGLSSEGVDVDVAEFERLVRDGSPSALGAAAPLYRGDLLHGITGQAPDFEHWLLAERERLREVALEGLGKLLAHERAAGHLEAALQIALRLAALDPLQEAVHRTLMRLYAEHEQPYACTLAHVWLGRIYFVQGEFAQASREWRAGFDIVQARQLGVPVGAGLGYAQVMSGDIVNGLSLLETEVARLLSTKWFGRKGVVSAWLGEAYMMAGRLVEAFDAAQRGLALVRERHQRGYEAMTLRLLGDIAMHGRRPDAAGAEKFYRQALVLAEDLGMRPLAARCYLGLGRLYLLLDKRPPAQGHLATARAMLAQMGIRLWLEQAEEALQALV